MRISRRSPYSNWRVLSGVPIGVEFGESGGLRLSFVSRRSRSNADIIFFDRKEDFFLNNLKEKGKKVEVDFDYNSGNNPDFLSVDQIKKTL